MANLNAFVTHNFDSQHRTAGKTEHRIDSLFQQHIYQRPRTRSIQKHASEKIYFTENFKLVRLLNFSPALKMQDGKFGWFGESG